jgi:hypothetical protein
VPQILTRYLPDRNERPFRCTLCKATFTRQDVYKRHNSRYHMEILPQQHRQGVSNEDPSDYMQSGSMRTSSSMISSVTARNAVGLSTAPGQPPVFDPASILEIDGPTVDSLISALDFPLIPESHVSSNATETVQKSPHPNLTLSCFTSPLENHAATTSQPQVIESPPWKGSFAISEHKWRQLASAVHTTTSVSLSLMLVLDLPASSA